jgi:DNA-binding transcriptional MerR regulator
MNTWTRKDVSEITGIPDRRLLFYSEQHILPGFKKNVGRGIAREYKKRDIFYLLVIKELDSLGVSLSQIRLVIMGLHVGNLDIPKLSIPKTWNNDGIVNDPSILIISFPQGPEEHALSPKAEGYKDELSIQIKNDINIVANRPSQIILNLNQISNKAKF